MPFECDVCGDECSYESRVFKLRNQAEIVICDKCLRKKTIKLQGDVTDD